MKKKKAKKNWKTEKFKSQHQGANKEASKKRSKKEEETNNNLCI